MAFHLWEISEVYSNNTGHIQYIELVCPLSANGETIIANHDITFTGSGNPEVYNVPSNLTSGTAGKSLLFASQGFADLGVVQPDFILPDDFFIDPNGGTLSVFEGVDSLTFESLPGSGTQSLNGSGATVNSSPTSFTGVSAIISGNPILGTTFAETLTGTDAKDFIVGLDGNDVINGGLGNDTIRGGVGADNLDGGGGTDRIQGEAGNDKMTWGAGDFFDGGANTDILRVGVATLNLTTAANSNDKLLNIEQIDLKVGAHTLTLNKADVLAMSPTDSIKILGDGADTVNIAGIQIEGGSAPAGFTRYRIGTAVLIIDSDIDVI